MGIEIDREEFDRADYERFAARLRESVTAIDELLARPGFGTGPKSIGAEVELNLVDASGRPCPVNRAVLAASLDPRVTLEVDRFNLELNCTPVPLAGTPLTALARELDEALAALRGAASQHGARLVTIGILPTLRETDFGASAMSDFIRYRALSKSLRESRGEPFAVHIDGEEELHVTLEDVTFEGAATSFQVHLRVDPSEFAAAYNAAQLATAPALALAANSPFFLGRRLWAETRVALFRQAVDDRADPAVHAWRPARVAFGHGYVRRGAAELFAESVALYEPLLPILTEENPLACVRAGGIPQLAELRLHQGTIWPWNRAVYDHAAGGHLRVELRALPAGPTVTDMVANAAFLLGLTLGLMPNIERLLPALTYKQARRNFYEAARHGLQAELLWPQVGAHAPRPRAAHELIGELLGVAETGLISAGVGSEEATHWLGVVAERLRSGVTGSTWQSAMVAKASPPVDRSTALQRMLEAYMSRSEGGEPVARWRL